MNGYKRSKKRDAIYAELMASKEHPSADEIYARLKPQIRDLSLATVYRNLAMFKREGLAIQVATVNGTDRFDGRTEPHMHFVCNNCGAVKDIELHDGIGTAIASIENSIHGRCEWVTISGVCSDCLHDSVGYERETVVMNKV